MVSINIGAAPFAYISNSGSNTISVIDTNNNTITATVTVGASPYALGQFIVTGAPVAIDDTGITTQNTVSAPISVVTNDIDYQDPGSFPEGVVTLQNAGAGIHGGLCVLNVNKKVAYTPASGFVGNECTYVVKNDSNVAKVSIAVTATTSSSGGGGGGCTLGTSSGFDTALLSMIFASLGVLGWRRLKAQK